MPDARTDQTDISYVRPGTWEASPGIPGIDQLHTFADPPRKPLGPPDNSPGSIPTVGPSAVGQTKAPAQNSRKWWWKRNAGQIQLDNQNGIDWTTEQGTEEPQEDTQRPRDPRTVALRAPRWTATRGPVSQAFMHRNTEHNMSGERRFVDVAGASFAFSPTLRPSPMAFGDGLPNIPRFRTTQRISPVPLDQQIVSEDQQVVSGPVLPVGGNLSQRWW